MPSLPIYGGADAGPRPGARDEVRAALERGVDPALVASFVGRGVDELVERLVAMDLEGEARPACRKGCAACCHQRVEVTVPEVLLLAGFLAAHPDERRRERVLVTAQDLEGKDGRAHHLAQIPCPLLDEEGACSVHVARPLACRRAHSVDVEACNRAHAEPERESVIPCSPSIDWNTSAVILGYLEGSAQAGFPPHQVELVRALKIALTEPDAEARWRTSEDPFVAARTRSAEALHEILGTHVNAPSVRAAR